MLHTVFRFFILGLLAALCSCNYNDFGDLPIDNTQQPITATLSSLPVGVVIEKDAVIEAVVVSSDSCGSFYRELILQERKGSFAVAMQLNIYDIYALWRPQMVVAVNFKGLAMVTNNGRLEAGILGDGSVAALGSLAMARAHIHFQGFYEQPIALHRTIGDIDDSDVGKLVFLREIYFVNQGTAYLGNQPLRELGSESSITLATSPYASFANDIVATGVFDLYAIVIKDADDGPLRLKISCPPLL